jgi:hypothetical protein
MVAARKRAKIALALAGGGPVGGIYEVGAMAALAEALDGVGLHRVRHLRRCQFRGLHSAAVANGLGPAALARMLVENDTNEVFDPEMLLRPAFGEYLRRALSVPVLFWSSLRQYLSDPWHLRLVGGFPGPQSCHSDRRFQQFGNRQAALRSCFRRAGGATIFASSSTAFSRGDRSRHRRVGGLRLRGA